jgi:hypothetical protein
MLSETIPPGTGRPQRAANQSPLYDCPPPPHPHPWSRSKSANKDDSLVQRACKATIGPRAVDALPYVACFLDPKNACLLIRGMARLTRLPEEWVLRFGNVPSNVETTCLNLC